ncbi:hypothetical protein CCP3SC15_180022 [Gammaproteobacteria bacterium]
MNATSTLDPALDQLRDIRGLDPISWWPVAPGWWVMVGVLATLIIVGLLIAWWVSIRNRDWRSDARHHLRELGARVHQAGAKEVAAQLSELLRRIAMARYGRTACASLTGEEWLNWLNTKDPAGFPWSERGRVLIDLPYAPPRDQVRIAGTDPNSLHALVEAVLPWLERDPPPQSSLGPRKIWENILGNKGEPSIMKQLLAFSPAALRIRFAHALGSNRD